MWFFGQNAVVQSTTTENASNKALRSGGSSAVASAKTPGQQPICNFWLHLMSPCRGIRLQNLHRCHALHQGSLDDNETQQSETGISLPCPEPNANNRQAASAVFNLSLLHNLFMLKYWFSFHSLRRGPKSVKSWWRVARTCCFCMDLTLPSHPRGTIGHRVHKFTNCLSANMFGNARQESKNGEMEAGSTSQISGKCFRHKRTCQSPHWACWRQSALSHCSGST